MTVIRIATRGSRLAVAQAKQAGEVIAPVLAGRPIEIVSIPTRGDTITGPLQDAGGKGLFTAELEAALREGTLDLAVHSAKDLPAEMTDDLRIAAVLPRADARDALVIQGKRGQVPFMHNGDGVAKKVPDPFSFLPPGANVGTSSLRRSALLRAARSDVEISHLRGNVDTRIRRVLGEKADFDATILAMAGLVRGGWLGELGSNIFPLPVDSFIPAAGQGTLVLQTREDNEELLTALQPIHHAETYQSLQAERSVVKHLGASCHSCLAVHVFPDKRGQVPFWRNNYGMEIREQEIKKVPDPFYLARAMVARADGSDMLRVETHGPSAQHAADALTRQLLTAGAKERLGNSLS
jgi:hydroxymethylbilane synthase